VSSATGIPKTGIGEPSGKLAAEHLEIHASTRASGPSSGWRAIPRWTRCATSSLCSHRPPDEPLPNQRAGAGAGAPRVLERLQVPRRAVPEGDDGAGGRRPIGHDRARPAGRGRGGGRTETVEPESTAHDQRCPAGLELRVSPPRSDMSVAFAVASASVQRNPTDLLASSCIHRTKGVTCELGAIGECTPSPGNSRPMCADGSACPPNEKHGMSYAVQAGVRRRLHAPPGAAHAAARRARRRARCEPRRRCRASSRSSDVHNCQRRQAKALDASKTRTFEVLRNVRKIRTFEVTLQRFPKRGLSNLR
jgi:hypothetical protein